MEHTNPNMIELGKQALQRHEISKAFDYLLVPAQDDAEAQKLFLMIFNTHRRIYLLSKEQMARLKDFADKGNAVSQYAFGRYHMIIRPESDSLEQAITLIEAAAKAGLPDALCAQGLLYRAGHYGWADNEKAKELLHEAYVKGSDFAIRDYLCQKIYGTHGTEANPQSVVNVIKDWMLVEESDDIAVVNPIYYELLGHAYAQLGYKENAEKYYKKAIAMGYVEAYSDYCILFNSTDENGSRPESYLSKLDLGCDAGDSFCFLFRAFAHMEEFDSCEDEQKEQLTAKIKEDLEKAVEQGSDMAPYFLGNAYYYGKYGFEENDMKAWNWLIDGCERDDSFAYSQIAQIILDGHQPEEVKEGTLEYCQLKALRYGDEDQLRNVVEAYRNGKLTFAAPEIEKYYIPKYDSLPHDEQEEEDEDDEEILDDFLESDYKLIAIIKTDGTTDIIEFDVEEGWDELPDYIGAKRLDAIRVMPLYNIGKELGYTTDHITGWVDNMGLLKDLPMNQVGCMIYSGPIAGDMILTLESDSGYHPKSFESLERLKKVIAALGAKLVRVDLDDGPDDDGRFDAWV